MKNLSQELLRIDIVNLKLEISNLERFLNLIEIGQINNEDDNYFINLKDWISESVRTTKAGLDTHERKSSNHIHELLNGSSREFTSFAIEEKKKMDKFK